MDVKTIESFLSNENLRWIVAALKGLRQGVVYGVKIRAPHALVMTFLFGRGTLLQKLLSILRATRMHATNLAKFVFSYKLTTGVLAKLCGEKQQWHSFISASVMGYYVWGENNNVNMQINLYLLSRITVALARLGAEKGLITTPSSPVFPIFASAVWGIVLWLFEHHPSTLQPSLQSSMKYLYHDSDRWTGALDDFVMTSHPEV